MCGQVQEEGNNETPLLGYVEVPSTSTEPPPEGSTLVGGKNKIGESLRRLQVKNVLAVFLHCWVQALIVQLVWQKKRVRLIIASSPNACMGA
jgi:hypothetical protein